MLRLGRFGVLPALLLVFCGCGDNASLFSDSFRNVISGNVVPLTPGEPSQFVLVRMVNNTRQAIEFVVTAQKQALTLDDQGNPVIESTDETLRMRTFPVETANEVGALFDCPVTRIGLGEDINRPFSEPGIFLLGEVDDPGNLPIGGGAGVPSNVFPLDSTAGNFGCGDTLIYRVIESQEGTGSLKVETFVLPWSTQPTEFTGPHTFNNARIFLEEQIVEEQ